VLYGLVLFDRNAEWSKQLPDLHTFIRAVAFMNLSLLCFNLLPIYPLDGGQILRSLLWYPLGKARSLMTSTVIGFLGGTALVAVAVWSQSIWIGLVSLFLLSNCWRGFQEARMLRRIERLPRRPEFACPACTSSPPIGIYWRCEKCTRPFDLFATSAICPQCGAAHNAATCVDCGKASPFLSWEKQDKVMV
jgi:hypothetical protein